MDDLIQFLHARYDDEQRNAEAYLSEVLGTRLEDDARFRLTDIEAKRRILAGIERRRSHGENDPWESANAETDGMASEVLGSLVLPYADHPDYRQEWRP